MSTTSFTGLLEDARLQMTNAGFVDQMWTPDFETVEEIHAAQMLAALQCYAHFFASLSKKVWVHLAAEMQAGKTGVMTALIRLLLDKTNNSKIGINPDSIFIVTGMGDNAWRKQTQDRLPSILRKNVYHNGGLDKVQTALGRLASRDGGLRNILIINDESHIASATNNRPNTLIYSTVQRLCPVEEWGARNIRFLTISATDPAKVLAMDGNTSVPSTVVRLHTIPEYQSVETLNAAGRIRYIEDIGANVLATVREIVETYTVPLYHIIRPSPRKHQEVIAKLREMFPTARVIAWDSSLKNRNAGTDDSSSLSSMKDVNELLETPPEQHTFIILKNMFYAAKTMKDQYVGLLCDRAGNKDDTNLQSLLGRACGYKKSNRTVIITSKQTVTNYLACWREMCARRNFQMDVQDIPAEKMDKKMPFVRATENDAGDVVMTQTTGHATPVSNGGGAGAGTNEAAAAAPARKTRETANEDNFTSEWREFSTFAEAKAWASRIEEKKQDADGFYLSSTTGTTKRVTYNEVLGLKAGKKTANLPWSTLKVNKSLNRLYVAYKDSADSSSGVFVVRRLTRVT
jgi:hypothetical protein